MNAAKLPDERLVFFRHYDPDVLASISPMLDAEQASQLLGKFSAFALVGGCADGAIVDRPENLPPIKSGPILFTPPQIAQLESRQRRLFHRALIHLLRRDFADQYTGKSDDVMLSIAQRHEVSAGKVGILSEFGIAQWSYLCASSNDAIARDPVWVRKQLLRRNANLDCALREEFDEILKASEIVKRRLTL